MRFAYSYKTSDNVRHEAEIDAPSRDAAFAALREMGIRPIKVVAEGGAGMSRKVILFVLSIAIVLFAVAVVTWWKWRMPPKEIGGTRTYTSDVSQIAYTNLVTQAAEITRRHRERLDEIGVDLLANYALVANTTDDTFFTSRIKNGYRAIDEARQAARALFRTLYDIFPSECVRERTDAQRLYVETMEEIDLTEERLANDDKAFRLLDANRGQWHVVRGKVVWNNVELAKEFEFLRRDADSAAVRWRRDFGDVESDVVTNPAAK